MLNGPDAAQWSPREPESIALREPAIGAEQRVFGAYLASQLQSSWLPVLLCIVAALPLLWPQVPPLIDLGGHLGRFAVQIDAGRTHGGSASLRHWYSFRWYIIPNLGADLLMQALAPAMGLEAALKAIVIAVVAAQTGGLLMLAKTAHGRVPPTALLALPLVYGYPFQFGFLNFALSTALATWALALWIHLGTPGFAVRRWLMFIPIAGALWVCHLAGWALFCVFATGIEAARWRDRGLDWRDVCRCAARPLSGLLAPCLMFAFAPHIGGAPGVTQGWFDIIDKLAMIVMALRDRWGWWDVGSVLMLLGTIGWTWRSRAFSQHSGLALGVLLAVAAFVVVPRHVDGTSFVDMRLVPMILAIALIAVRPRDDSPPRVVAALERDAKKWAPVFRLKSRENQESRALCDSFLSHNALAVAGLLFCGARFAGNAVSLALFDRQFTQDLAVLDSMPRDALLVTLTVKPCGANDSWRRERRTHLAGYALARRHDFANDQWSDAAGQLLRVHNPAMGPFIGDPSQIAYPPGCRGKPSVRAVVATVPPAVPYLWIIDTGAARDLPGWTPIRLSPGSVLYTRARQATDADMIYRDRTPIA